MSAGQVRPEFEARCDLFRERNLRLMASDGRLRALVLQAKELGVRIVLSDLDDGFLGLCDNDNAKIYIDVGLSPSEFLSTLAHEVGHAIHGHGRGGVAEFEDAAARWAAEFLIDSAEWATYCRVYGGVRVAFFSECFGVTEDVVRDFHRLRKSKGAEMRELDRVE